MTALNQTTSMILEDYRTQFKERLLTVQTPEEVDAITAIALEFALEKSRVEIALSRKQKISYSQKTALDAMLDRLMQEEPIHYIIGQTEFYGLKIKVTPDTLIPRPETEELVSWLIEDTIATQPEAAIVDIGTGSGCIAIAVAKNAPRAEISAIDISGAALEIAQKNAVAHKVDVTFIKKDILKEQNLPKRYDAIVSNPPYVRGLEKAEIKKNVLQYEPHTALFVPDNDPLLFYRKIAALAQQHLKPQGQLYFEINEYLGQETISLLKEMGYKKVALRQDHYGKDRMIKAAR